MCFGIQNFLVLKGKFKSMIMVKNTPKKKKNPHQFLMSKRYIKDHLVSNDNFRILVTDNN